MAEFLLRYEDISPTAKQESTYIASHAETYSDYSDAFKKEETHPIDVIGMEKNLWKLDGTKKLFPDDPSTVDWGFVSSVISDDNGNFENGEEPSLTVTMTNRISTPALTFNFDSFNEDYPSEITLTYYRGSEVLDSSDYFPNKSVFYAQGNVEYYDKVVIVFKKTNIPRRKVRVSNIIYGIIREFDYDEIESMSGLEEMNPISNELSINTFNFSVMNKTPISFMFQKMQKLSLFEDKNLVGIYYTDTAKRRNSNFYELECVDTIGVLDKSNFYGDVYENKNAGELIAQIFNGTNINYNLQESLSSKKISGYIPNTTKREALLYILFAIGAVADTSRSDVVNIFTLSDEVISSFDDSTTFMKGSEEIDSNVTSVSLSAWSYSKSADNSSELYKGTLSVGDHSIIFNGPQYNVTATNATIKDVNANYCLINVTDDTKEVVVTGYSYVETEKVHTLKNELTTSSDVENVKTSNSCKLINEENVDEILENYYNYSVLRNKLEAGIIVANEKCGDIIEVRTVYDETVKIRIESISMSFGNKKFGKIEGRVIK